MQEFLISYPSFYNYKYYDYYVIKKNGKVLFRLCTLDCDYGCLSKTEAVIISRETKLFDMLKQFINN